MPNSRLLLVLSCWLCHVNSADYDEFWLPKGCIPNPTIIGQDLNDCNAQLPSGCSGLQLSNCRNIILPSRRMCCKSGWAIGEQQRQQIATHFNAKTPYTANSQTLRRESMVKYEYIEAIGTTPASYKMSVVRLKETEAGQLLAHTTASEYQLNGQLNAKWSSNKKQQTEVAHAGMDTEAAKARNYVWNGRCDARIKIPNAERRYKEKPFGRVGLLSIPTTPNTVSQCTATAISKRLLITALHCVFINDGWIGANGPLVFALPNGIRWYPGLDAEGERTASVRPRGRAVTFYTVKTLFATYGYIERATSAPPADKRTCAEYDIALLELAEDISVGYLGFGYYPTATIRGWRDDNNDKIITIGYPADKEDKGIREHDANFQNPWGMHMGLVIKGGTVPQIDIGLDAYALGVPSTTVTLPGAELSDLRIVDNKYYLYQGQSGSSIFHWKAAHNVIDRQYVIFAVLSGGSGRGMERKYMEGYYTRITALRAQLYKDIIDGATNVVHSVPELAAHSIYRNYYDLGNINAYDVDLKKAQSDKSQWYYYDDYNIRETTTFEAYLYAAVLIEMLVMVLLIAMLLALCMCGLFALIKYGESKDNELQLNSFE